MDRFNKYDLKRASHGQWKQIIHAIAGISPGISPDIMDGNHHPCPKCGGNDRFRMVCENDGALFCNNCFSTKNGDGIAAIEWLLDCDFPAAMEKIGHHLGLDPEKKKSLKKKADPAAKLEFCDWNETLAALWCLKKKPIKPKALLCLGARMAMYDGQFKVIALPVWSGKPENVVGWNLYNITGGTLPKWKGKGKPLEQVKVKLTFGSKSGLIGYFDSENPVVYKTEGPTDLLALVSLDPSASCICNANGAKENPVKSFGWLPDLINGADINIVHDCDVPGQEGAMMVKDRPGWAPWFARECPDSVVKNIVLPYPIAQTKGKDIRDWTAEGNGLDQLAELIDGTEPTEPAEDSDSPVDVWEANDDPHRLARVIKQTYKNDHQGKLVQWRGEWWKYKKGCYRRIATKELRAKFNHQIRKQFVEDWLEEDDTEEKGPVKRVTESLVTNVLAAAAADSCIPDSVQMPKWLGDDRETRNLLSMKNCLLDIDGIFEMKNVEECKLEHSEDWFSPVKVEYDFDTKSESPMFDMLLRTSVGDPEVIRLLQQWSGYLLLPGNKYQKFLALSGEGRNGKSSFFAVMTALISHQNISTVGMHEFENRFRIATTVGKMANICDDVGEIDSTAEGIIKQFTGGGRMQAEKKGQDAFEFLPSAKLMFSWNQPPRFRDRSYGLWRRMIMVEFNKTIKAKEQIQGLSDPQWWLDSGEMSAVLNWAIHGAHDLIKNGFIVPESCRRDMEKLRAQSNPTGVFIDENLEATFANSNECLVCTELYNTYNQWCKSNGYKAMNSANFGRELRKKFKGVDRSRKRIMGQLTWVYSGLTSKPENDDTEHFIQGL